MSTVPFTRPTIIAAVAFMDWNLSQASFNHLVLRLGHRRASYELHLERLEL
jgi:hypothetical protein